MNELQEKILYDLKQREEEAKTLPVYNDVLERESSYEYEQLRERLQKMKETRIINSSIKTESGRSFIGALKSIWKKMTRKSVKWYIDQIIIQQMEFNTNTVVAVEHVKEICEKFEAVSKSYDENKAFIYAMNAKCEDSQFTLSEENKRLQNLCNELQNELNELKAKL